VYRCDECGGKGKVITKVCPRCGGSKVHDHTQEYTLEVTPGMPEGYEVVFEGEGDENPDWEPGDVVLKVRSAKAEGGFKRKESSLHWRETIGIDEVRHLAEGAAVSHRQLSHSQALLGFERNLTHLDGHVVQLKRTGVTQPGMICFVVSS